MQEAIVASQKEVEAETTAADEEDTAINNAWEKTSRKRPRQTTKTDQPSEIETAGKNEELSDGFGDFDSDEDDDDGDDSATDQPTSNVPKKSRLRKKGEVVVAADSNKRRSTKRQTAFDEDSDSDDSPIQQSQKSRDHRNASSSSLTPPPAETQSSVKKDAIPKKKQDANAIPRASKAAPPTSSLLAHLEKPPPGAIPPSTTTSNQQLSKNATTQQSRKPPHSQQGRKRFQNRDGPPQMTFTLDGAEQPDPFKSQPVRYPPDAAQRQPQKAPATTTNNSNDGRPNLLFKALDRMCEAVSTAKPFANLRVQPPIASVDLSGSFVNEFSNSSNNTELDHKRYDFFDTNQRGEIVLQPKIPIFPEEFPPGMKEHSLSWWGILDPALGDGKFRNPQQQPVLNPHASRSHSEGPYEAGPPPGRGDQYQRQGRGMDGGWNDPWPRQSQQPPQQMMNGPPPGWRGREGSGGARGPPWGDRPPGRPYGGASRHPYGGNTPPRSYNR